MLTPQKFYDLLSDDYDSMTADSRRWENQRESLVRIVEGLGGKPRVLDAGCGTGGLALLMASLGCVVTGVDISGELLSVARKKAEALGLSVEFMEGNLTKLSLLPDKNFNLILCIGNTLPHLRQSSDLSALFRTFARVAAPDALLIVSWLNYIPILRDKRRLIGITEGKGKMFVRFYDFISEGDLDFNILSLDQQDESSHRKWQGNIITTRLSPWQADDVGMEIKQSGWGDLEIGSDLARGDFDPDSSRDAVYFAVKD